MPRFEITSPDGRRFEVNAPEGATQADAVAYVQSQMAGPQRRADDLDPTTQAINRSPTAGILDAAAALGSGAVAAPVAGLAGLAGAILPGPEGQGARAVHAVQDALTYTPKTPIGQGITKAVTYPFQKLAEGAEAAGGAAAEKTGSPASGALANTAIQAIPLMLGRVAPVGEGAAATAARNAAKSRNAQYDAGTIKAQEVGYVVPPSQANPSILNQLAEGAAGKIKTAQAASLKNQPVTNGLVRQAFGLSDDTPLSVDTLNAVREKAGTAYETVRGAGRVTADTAYRDALDSLREPYLRAAKDFPRAAQTEVLEAIDSMRVPAFDAASAVDQIKILRKEADKRYASGDKNLGGTYKGLANALEEQLGRHLETSGASPDALAAFQQARQTIAQTYTVQKHLKPDGNVDAVGLGRELKRKPLSGPIRTAAEFGEQFPKAAQKPERVGGVPISALDMGIGGMAALATQNPTLFALVAGRPAARAAILSKPYQNTMTRPSYGPSVFDRLKSAVLDAQGNPLVPLAEMGEAQQRR